MPLFDAKILDDEFDGAALLASVLFATPKAKADALARGRERLALAGSADLAMSQDVTGSSNASRGVSETHTA